MQPSAPRRPAVPHVLALLAGLTLAALGGRVPPGLEGVAAALLLLGLVAHRLHGARALGPVLGAVLFAGLVIGSGDAERSATRVSALFPEAGIPLETDFLGRVLRLPERTAEGEQLLFLRGRPVAGPLREGPLLTVRLIVQASSAKARRNLERLGAGDLVRVWARLVVPRGHANPGAAKQGAGLRARGLDAVGGVKTGLLVERVEPGRAGPLRWIEDAKREARRRLDAAVDPVGPRRAILGAVLLGDRAGIPVELQRTLRSGGLVHLVAISGLHVGLLAAICLGALRRLRLSNVLLLAVACVLLPAFGWGVGPRPPVLRAALAAALALAGRCSGREADAVNGLALIAALIALVRPAVLLDAGFQLSFLATAAILLRAPGLARLLPGPRWLALGLAVSASAYLGAAPVVAWHFHWLAPVALASNVAAAPICALLLVAGYGAIALHELPLLGDWLGPLAGTTAGALVRLASLASWFDFAGWRVPRPAVWALAVFYAGLFGPALLGDSPRRAWRRWAGSALALVTIWIHVGPPPGVGERLQAAVVDVGQGQAVLLRGPGQGAVLVDAGGGAHPRFDPGERLLLPFLDHWGLRRLDLLVASHGDIDHVGGAFAVLREVEVGELWLAPGSHRHPRLAALAELARKRGTSVALAERGLRRRRGGVALRVLGPGRESGELSGNDRSLVLVAGGAPSRLLIAGDLGADGEAELIAAGAELEAEALIVGHHGAAGGTGPAFLSRVRPRHAVISCGYRNRFGHPHPDTLARLRAVGARVWRTDRQGVVRLVARERGWEVSGWSRPAQSLGPCE